MCIRDRDTFIGVPDEERASMQTLKADITFYPEEALSGRNDDFSRTVCYDSMSLSLIHIFHVV